MSVRTKNGETLLARCGQTRWPAHDDDSLSKSGDHGDSSKHARGVCPETDAAETTPPSGRSTSDAGAIWWTHRRFSAFAIPSLPRTTSPRFGPQTALHVRDDVPFWVAPLHEACRPYVMNNSPYASSLGRSCAEDGAAFHRPASSTSPYFITSKGETVSLTLDHYILFLDVDAVPTVAATDEPSPVGHDRKAASTDATTHMATALEVTDSTSLSRVEGFVQRPARWRVIL